MNTTTTHAVIRAILETMKEMDPGAGTALATRLKPVVDRARESNWEPDGDEVAAFIALAER